MSPAGRAANAAPHRVDDSLVELLTETQRRVARGVCAVLAEDGTTLDGFRLLRSLAAARGRSMRELAALLCLPAPTLTRLVDGAVEAALAYRLPDPDDGRKVVVHLSELGRTRLDRLEGLVGAHEGALANRLGADRVEVLLQALRKLTATEGWLR